MDQIRIGTFIAKLRKEKKLTQEQLAEKLGVTSKSISRWENGVCLPDFSLLKNLSDILGVSINELMSGEKIKDEKYQERFEENIVNAISDVDNSNQRHRLFINIILGSCIFIIIYIAGYNFYNFYEFTQEYNENMTFEKCLETEELKNDDYNEYNYSISIESNKYSTELTNHIITTYYENDNKYGVIFIQNKKTPKELLSKEPIFSATDLTQKTNHHSIISLEDSNIPKHFKVYYTTINFKDIVNADENNDNDKMLEIIEQSTFMYEE